MKKNVCPLAVVLLVLAVPPGAGAGEPAIPQADLMLWLDAGDSATHTVIDGRLAEWKDRSPQAHHAVQTDAGARPRRVQDSIGGRPAVRFGGGTFLNLGQPTGLDLPPGTPFTIVAVYRVDEGKFGTLLAQGGGPETGRGYHFYTAAGRLGGIVHGVRRETPLGAGPQLVALVSDGRSAELRHDGSTIRFTGGQAGSPGDVLVGVRRETAQNTGTFWPLEGDLAELIVYRAALDRRQYAQVDAYLRKKYDFADPGEALVQAGRA